MPPEALDMSPEALADYFKLPALKQYLILSSESNKYIAPSNVTNPGPADKLLTTLQMH